MKLTWSLKRFVPPELYLKYRFKKELGYGLNLKKPKSFNEKLQWLKLYDHKSIYTSMVDKFAAKEFVASIIGEQYIIPTLGVWDNFESINFDILPNAFVLKTTHDSGGIFIVKDKEIFLNNSDLFNHAKKKLKSSLNNNFYYAALEWPYKNVKPRIIAEKYMVDSDQKVDLTDYKLMCFNGKVRCTFTCTERFEKNGMKVTFFDNDWNVLPFERHYPRSTKHIPAPTNFEEMKELASKLSANTSFLRVDFYEINKKIYFGELTFYPGSGFEEFRPKEWDYIMGSWLQLPCKS